MKRLGITGKIFLMLIVTFGIVIGAVLVGSTYFFEKYYIERKIEGLEEKTRGFIEDNIEGGRLEEHEIIEMAKAFSAENETPLAVKLGREIFYPFSRYAVELEKDGRITMVEINNVMFELQEREVEIRNGMDISFTGFRDGEQIIAVSLDRPSKEEILRFSIDFQREAEDFVRVGGRVVAKEIPRYDAGSVYRQDALFNMSQRYASGGERIPREVRVIQEEDRMTGIKNFMIVVPHKRGAAFCLFTMQPVREVISMIPGFMKYVVIIAAVLVAAMAFIITRIIVRPIISMNKTAKKMARLDFGERVEESHDDEIGDLSRNLNIMADELEATIGELGRKNERLRGELERERMLEKARKNFVADASHELKTPLGIVQAYTERIADKFAMDEKAARYASIILDENRKMNKLINDLLELSKLESMTYKLSRKEMDISAEAIEIYERFSPIFEEKQISIECEVEEGLFINADEGKMVQVMTNMVSNALKYSPKGKRAVLNLNRKGEKAVFRIANEVENWDRLDMEKIWDRFYKADKARSRKMGGTGLGLSITRSILELHGFEFGVIRDGNFIEFYFEAPTGGKISLN